MTHSRVSRAVARLLRPFHRQEHKSTVDDAASKPQRGSLNSSATSTCSTSPSSSRNCDSVRNVFSLKINNDGIPYAVLMPSALSRYLRALVEQANALTTSDHRASHKIPETSFASSRSSIRWRGDFSTRTLEKLVQLLTEDDTDGFTSTIGRRSSDGAAPEPSLRHTMAHSKDVAIAAAKGKKHQLEQAALALLVVVIKRQEFDALLVAAGHGGCKSHKPADEARHGMSRLSRRLSRHSRRSKVRETRVSLSSNSSSQHKIAKRGQERTIRLCDSVHHLLELHQSTLQYAFDTVHGPIDVSSSSTEFTPLDQHQILLAVLVGTSYTRVPRLRGHILDNLSNVMPSTTFRNKQSESFSSINSRERNKSVYDDKLRLTTFHWHLNLYPQCQNLLTTVNREDRWASSTQIISYLMADLDNCMVVLAQLLEQLNGQQVLGFTDWKCVPGADLLKDAILNIVQASYQMELLQREPKWQDGLEEKSDEASLACDELALRESSTFGGVVEELNSPTAYFARRVTSMMHENVSFIHDYTITILRVTNYMLPHHVNVCLEYLEKLVTDFPFYFVNEPAVHDLINAESSDCHTQPQQERVCVDVETFRFVFSCLLGSEHFEILKATELFLLRNFVKFSVSLQVQITKLLAEHVKRLFLHWNRDVRFCYFHILLYLTYPGNRIVLGAKSDEAIMGAEASRLFEIPGLIRTSSTVSWEIFDVPLQQIVARYIQMTKRRPVGTHKPTWVDAVPWHILQRSVTEYKIHLKSYFIYAQQVSVHQRVPIPEFTVKTGEDASSAAPAAATLNDIDQPCCARCEWCATCKTKYGSPVAPSRLRTVKGEISWRSGER
ncbi:uncharacterized protein PHALS_07577 [Plasmopara halstedii]|uniref:Uncharacterized protein n=1 Tax=Plasmopara halstedii TaxID=4781 RepID=A0A0P1B7C4_PLAHL|nr:uncharacterized protein PHALS_07577 [Plasmopara halstedii]CEG49836.1 hypothetical protein PHALS_07577 [Plasmopara halstedii]|eukprot:XP_024586205.1 hypothetical protein PHALS_07577 [Plasmopara halstedii]